MDGCECCRGRSWKFRTLRRSPTIAGDAGECALLRQAPTECLSCRGGRAMRHYRSAQKGQTRPVTREMWAQSPEAVAATLRKAFPDYSVTVRRDGGEPRFQLLAKDDRNPWCVISPDVQEIRRELEGQ
jgi:hypothetical protein